MHEPDFSDEPADADEQDVLPRKRFADAQLTGMRPTVKKNYGAIRSARAARGCVNRGLQTMRLTVPAKLSKQFPSLDPAIRRPAGEPRQGPSRAHDRIKQPAGRAAISKFQAICGQPFRDRKSTRLNSSHITISYAVFCLKKKKT